MKCEKQKTQEYKTHYIDKFTSERPEIMAHHLKESLILLSKCKKKKTYHKWVTFEQINH